MNASYNIKLTLANQDTPFDVDWLSEHMVQVHRMLCSGMDICGFYIVKEDDFDDLHILMSRLYSLCGCDVGDVFYSVYIRDSCFDVGVYSVQENDVV